MIFTVTDNTPYHLSPHSARTLLDPLRDELERLEDRTRHFEARIPLTSGDEAASLREATAALAQARAAIEAVMAREAAAAKTPLGHHPGVES